MFCLTLTMRLAPERGLPDVVGNGAVGHAASGAGVARDSRFHSTHNEPARMMENPLPVGRALAMVRSWVAAPCVELIRPGAKHAEILFGLLEGTAGNLTTD
jgi:hypothetical protein